MLEIGHEEDSSVRIEGEQNKIFCLSIKVERNVLVALFKHEISRDVVCSTGDFEIDTVLELIGD